MSTAPNKPTTRVPGENAGREAQPRMTSAEEAIVQARAAEVAAVSSSAPQPKTTMPLASSPEQEMATLRAQMVEMEKRMTEHLTSVLQVNRVLSAQVRAGLPAAQPEVKLPTMAATIASHPDGPVLTEEGWFVPRVTSSNPEAQTAAALITAMRQGMFPVETEHATFEVERKKAADKADA